MSDLIKYTDKEKQALNLFESTRTWLPRLEILANTSKRVNFELGMIPGSILIIKDKTNVINLKKQCDLIPLTYKAKAIALQDPGFPTSYDPESELFKKIVERSTQQNSGAVWGIEFLFYVPEHGFCTFFASSRTNRQRCQPMSSTYKNKSITIKTVELSNTKGKWWSFDIVPCAAEIRIDLSDEDIAKTICDFTSAKIETVVEEATDSRAR